MMKLELATAAPYSEGRFLTASTPEKAPVQSHEQRARGEDPFPLYKVKYKLSGGAGSPRKMMGTLDHYRTLMLTRYFTKAAAALR